MGEYTLVEERDYQHLRCVKPAECFVREISMYGYGDAISFFRTNKKSKIPEQFGTY